MKATRDFLERTQGMREYKKGDPYSNKDKSRVEYLLEKGYIAEPKPPKDKKEEGSKEPDNKKSGE